MQNEKDKPKTTIRYYGQKVYRLNPLIARKKAPAPDKPECRYEDEDEEILRARK